MEGGFQDNDFCIENIPVLFVWIQGKIFLLEMTRQAEKETEDKVEFRLQFVLWGQNKDFYFTMSQEAGDHKQQ